MKERLVGIVAINDQYGGMGFKGGMAWHSKDDMRLFKETTMNGTVIMGSRTYDSLPVCARPLEGRTNVVLTRSPTQGAWYTEGGVYRWDVERILEEAKYLDVPLFVIGGAQTFDALWEHIDAFQVSHIQANAETDICFDVDRLRRDFSLHHTKRTGETGNLTVAYYERRR